MESHGNLDGEARGRRYQDNGKRVVRNMEERNRDHKFRRRKFRRVNFNRHRQESALFVESLRIDKVFPILYLNLHMIYMVVALSQVVDLVLCNNTAE